MSSWMVGYIVMSISIAGGLFALWINICSKKQLARRVLALPLWVPFSIPLAIFLVFRRLIITAFPREEEEIETTHTGPYR